MARIPIIIGQHISRHGQAQAATNPKSRVDKRFTKTPNQWAEMGVWAGVKSSNVRQIRYDWHGKLLFVRFKDGSVYRYPGVSKRLALDFFNGRISPGGSFGKAVWVLRRRGFVGVKVSGD